MASFVPILYLYTGLLPQFNHVLEGAVEIIIMPVLLYVNLVILKYK